MGSSSSLGPDHARGHLNVDAALREPVRFLAMRKTRDPDLLLGMLDRDADLRLVHTADKTVHYVLADNMKAFRQTHEVVDDQPAWEGGQRGVLTAAAGAKKGFASGRPIAPPKSPAFTRSAANRPVDDPTLGPGDPAGLDQARRAARSPSWFSYLTRSLEQARQEKKNLLILEINSPGGIETAGDDLADMIVGDQGHENSRLHRRPRDGGGRALAAGLPRHRLQEDGADGRRPPDDQWCATDACTT